MVCVPGRGVHREPGSLRGWFRRHVERVHGQPLNIVTKNALVVRDLDLLKPESDATRPAAETTNCCVPTTFAAA